MEVWLVVFICIAAVFGINWVFRMVENRQGPRNALRGYIKDLKNSTPGLREKGLCEWQGFGATGQSWCDAPAVGPHPVDQKFQVCARHQLSPRAIMGGFRTP